MPVKVLDPKDRQAAPVGLAVAEKDKAWEHVDALGEFTPVVPGKFETGMTTRTEKERGIISIRVKDGVREDIVLAEDRIVDVKPTKIDMEVNNGIGTVAEAGVGVAGQGAGGTRVPVDTGRVPAGRTERVVPG